MSYDAPAGHDSIGVDPRVQLLRLWRLGPGPRGSARHLFVHLHRHRQPAMPAGPKEDRDGCCCYVAGAVIPSHA